MQSTAEVHRGDIFRFMHRQYKATLEVLPIPSVMVKDQFLHLRKKIGLNVDLTTIRKGLSVALEEEDEAPPSFNQKNKAKTSIVVEEVSWSDSK